MGHQPVHRRYARALYDEAKDENIIERLDEEVAFLQRTLEQSRELRQLFKSPIVSRDKKQAVVDGLFADRVHPLTLQFLTIVVRKGRENELEGILDAYRVLRDEEEGIVEVQVKVARPLDEESTAALTRRLEEVVESKVRLNTTIDEELVGGVVVRIGDVVYNASVQHHLAELHERLRQGAAVNGSAA